MYKKFSSPSTEITDNSVSCESGRSFNLSSNFDKEKEEYEFYNSGSMNFMNNTFSVPSTKSVPMNFQSSIGFYPRFPNSEKKSRKNKMVESDVEKIKYNVILTNVIQGIDTRTTIMIKNLPNKFDQKMLLSIMKENHKFRYDFFYLPIDFKNNCNVGYAFINFAHPLFVLPFYNEFNGQKWSRYNSEKVCQITYGRIQGKVALIEHFQSSKVMDHIDRKVKPLILHSILPTQSLLDSIKMKYNYLNPTLFPKATTYLKKKEESK